MTTAQQQQQRQRASARDRAEQHGSKMADYMKLPPKQKLWRPEAAGVVLIDILPYVVGPGNPYADAGQLFYERTFYIYTDMGPNRERCIAPSKTWKQRDPVAEYRQHIAFRVLAIQDDFPDSPADTVGISHRDVVCRAAEGAGDVDVGPGGGEAGAELDPSSTVHFLKSFQSCGLRHRRVA